MNEQIQFPPTDLLSLTIGREDKTKFDNDGAILHRMERMDDLIAALNRLAAALEKSQE